MIELELYGVRVRLCFGFFAVTALAVSLSGSSVPALALLASILHEAGHLIVMKLYGVRLKGLMLYAAGIKITHEKRLIPVRAEMAVLAAGCCVNFALYMIWRGTAFGYVNLFLGMFNLLPVGALDGGRMLRLVISELFPASPAAVSNICRAGGCVSAVLLFVASAFMGIHNPAVYFAGGFMIFSAMIYDR